MKHENCHVPGIYALLHINTVSVHASNTVDFYQTVALKGNSSRFPQ